MKTSPFNLKKALVGEPIVTRDGLSVIGFRPTKNPEYVPYIAWILSKDGTSKAEWCFTENGMFYRSSYSEPYYMDLFMLETEPKRIQSNEVQKHSHHKKTQMKKEEEKSFEVWEDIGEGRDMRIGAYETEEQSLESIRKLALREHNNQVKPTVFRIMLKLGEYKPIAKTKTTISLKKIK